VVVYPVDHLVLLNRLDVVVALTAVFTNTKKVPLRT
jgi:hypothetical protein